MSALRLHFSFEPNKPDIQAFADGLINDFGQVDFDDADTVITIGGDGSLLHAFSRASKGQKFMGLVPPSSNSRGFWTNHGIKNSLGLSDALDAANNFKITPLKAKILFTDKGTRTVHAFNEVAPGENSGQAMLAHLSLHSANNSIGPIRIMGDGLIIATPFGSTAMNRTYGGATIDIRNSGIAITGKGIYQPASFNPAIAEDGTTFEIEFLSPDKRPVRLQYDGKKITSEMNNPFERMTVEKAPERSIDLLLVDDPATRAFANIL